MSIRYWPEGERPREKLLARGSGALSDAELLAVLLGNGVRGKAAVEEFFDKNIATNNLRVECEETFPSSSELEVAHILTLHSEFEGGLKSHVRGVFTYTLNEDHLITNLRGWWNMDAMVFEQAEA